MCLSAVATSGKFNLSRLAQSRLVLGTFCQSLLPPLKWLHRSIVPNIYAAPSITCPCRALGPFPALWFQLSVFAQVISDFGRPNPLGHSGPVLLESENHRSTRTLLNVRNPHYWLLCRAQIPFWTKRRHPAQPEFNLELHLAISILHFCSSESASHGTICPR